MTINEITTTQDKHHGKKMDLYFPKCRLWQGSRQDIVKNYLTVRHIYMTIHENRKIGDAVVLQEEVSEDICTLKTGKSSGIANIPAELLKYGGQETETFMTTILFTRRNGIQNSG